MWCSLIARYSLFWIHVVWKYLITVIGLPATKTFDLGIFNYRSLLIVLYGFKLTWAKLIKNKFFVVDEPSCNYLQSRARDLILIISFICISALSNKLFSPCFFYLLNFSLIIESWAMITDSRSNFTLKLILKRFLQCFGAVNVKETCISKVTLTYCRRCRTCWFQATNHSFLF